MSDTDINVSEQSGDQKSAENLLNKALAEAQQTIRSYDTKAQICAIGYVFSLNIVLGINQTLWPEPEANIWVVIVGWLVLVLPMVFFAYVLYPTRSSIASENRGANNTIRKVLYNRRERYQTAEQVKEAALSANSLDELAFELVKISNRRDRKRQRFMRALLLSFFAFIVMFLAHLSEIISRTI